MDCQLCLQLWRTWTLGSREWLHALEDAQAQRDLPPKCCLFLTPGWRPDLPVHFPLCGRCLNCPVIPRRGSGALRRSSHLGHERALRTRRSPSASRKTKTLEPPSPTTRSEPRRRTTGACSLQGRHSCNPTFLPELNHLLLFPEKLLQFGLSLQALPAARIPQDRLREGARRR